MEPRSSIPDRSFHFAKDSQAHTRDYARALDGEDALSKFADEFCIPSTADLLATKVSANVDASQHTSEKAIYLTGHSLGLQPRRTAEYIQSHLTTWALKGVQGHFTPMEDSPIPAYVDAGDVVAEKMARLVGASSAPVEEVAVMQTLTANLHLLMASFYRPDPKGRFKVLVEEKAFPSDHYAVESQIRHHGLDPAEAMIVLQPDSPDGIFSTAHTLSVIDQHASTLAVLLLPGVQYYTGQYLDVPTVTAHAHSVARTHEDDEGIMVGWDLAHAVGNVELRLHDWNVDFAVWCNYKYVNGGPGVIGGLFVHERRGQVGVHDRLQEKFGEKDHGGGGGGGGGSGGVTGKNSASSALGYRHRLAGWWGSDKVSRFRMENNFIPLPGAAGYQLSNPSILDICAVMASLAVFDEAGMEALRKKSILLTGYLEYLLSHESLDASKSLESNQPDVPKDATSSSRPSPIYRIITPSDQSARGAQLSIRFFADDAPQQHRQQPKQQVDDAEASEGTTSLTRQEKEELLKRVMASLESDGIVVDHRRPDVIRVAPVPLYNSFEDVWVFVDRFKKAVLDALSIEWQEGKQEEREKERENGREKGREQGQAQGQGRMMERGEDEKHVSAPEQALGRKQEGGLDV